MMEVCKVCHKELKDSEWIKIDYRNRLTHCTCDSLRSDLKDLDTYKNIKNKYYSFIRVAN